MAILGAADALQQADALSWREFEGLVQEMLERSRYECAYVNGKRDHGADLIATKAGVKLGIQVKHVADGRRWVGETAVRAIVTALPLYKCTDGWVVTNSRFAPGVKRVARAHGVGLKDRDWLQRELASFCVLCGERVSWKVRSWCLDRPEQFGGNTYCFEHQHGLTGLLRKAPS